MTANPMTHPSPEAVAKAMDYAVVVARDMKRRAARGTHPDMPSETCIDTLAAHVTALTSKLKSLQARLEDVSTQLETERAKVADAVEAQEVIYDSLSAETARAEAAEARAAAMEAALEEISGHAPVKTPPDYATSSDTGEAFDDGYSRGVWEMGQIADAALAPQAEAGEG